MESLHVKTLNKGIHSNMSWHLLCFVRQLKICIKRILYLESSFILSYLFHRRVDVSCFQRVWYELCFDAFRMAPGYEMSLHMYCMCIPGELFGTCGLLASRGVSSQWRSKLSIRVKTSPQLSHSWRVFLGGVESTSSCKN